jgi:hypothetical protein
MSEGLGMIRLDLKCKCKCSIIVSVYCKEMSISRVCAMGAALK